MLRGINKFKLGLILLLGIETMSKACEACELQQPKLTRGLTHGAGPQSNWDWVLVAIMTVITILTLIYSFWYLIKPKEKENEHIKRAILKF